MLVLLIFLSCLTACSSSFIDEMQTYESECLTEGAFTCLAGGCVAQDKYCDGNYDCEDGSDENFCINHPPDEHYCNDTHQFMCADSLKCIPSAWVCNEEVDCSDGSDEVNCPTVVVPDNANSTCKGFLCDGKKCISRFWMCDGYYDCNDRSDEDARDTCRHILHSKTLHDMYLHDLSYCEKRGRYTCLDKSYCLPAEYMCDGLKDCKDGSDEGTFCEHFRLRIEWKIHETMPPHRYTASEYTDMILIYGECKQNAALALKTYKERYGATRTCPKSVRTITLALKKLRGNQALVPASTVLQPIEVTAVDPTRYKNSSIYKSQQAARRPLVRNKSENPLQLSKAQLVTFEVPGRETFCRWILGKVSEDPDFLSNIMWTGESIFAPNGVMSNKNRHFWCAPGVWPYMFAKPEEDIVKVHVWAGIHRNEIIGPIFIDGNLNTAKFLELLSGPVADYLEELPLNVRQQLWYQLNGLPAHSVPVARERLSEIFGKQWIGRNGPCEWPPKSSDLSPLEVALWKNIKKQVYGNERHMKVCADALKKSISSAFDKLKTTVTKSDLLTRERNKILIQCKNSINKGNLFKRKKK
ncbi:jg24982 [Pararge aegeria aegeria]|uniref:Jg24982 protein n=2 Tax=Pararge aegeria TaxID=116150 RepID=A0A8S4SB00_9NEOP|nr:jg24982 [Pararge aegeria aegeria]